MIANIGKTVRFIDLFCGIGGFRHAIEGAADKTGARVECVLSSDIDPDCRRAYEANFGEPPLGDIHEIPAESVPDHDILLAGFPCQPFSIIGHRRGFEDARGTLFFEIARIIEAKKPEAFVLENVKLLAGHNGGKTLARILEVLQGLGYQTDRRIFNALDFGLPQKRERIFIVGFKNPRAFEWPKGGMPMKPLREILEKRVPKTYYASEHIRKRRLAECRPTKEPTIWHENKAGHVSAYPYSCALRAGASYNYLLVNGERRLTPREMLRLQGFPDSFQIVCNYSQTRKQAGNSLPVPVAEAVLRNVFVSCGWTGGVPSECVCPDKSSFDNQIMLLEKGSRYGKPPKTQNSPKISAPLAAQ
ncbi:DNA (cytosine-5-)-methyltransferase [Oscillatoria amoena NRMC-F 0135]|nr:DNA (cytosine-5-)-methyltransferase [Oscillatoria amoena NRMC-F 0135]